MSRNQVLLAQRRRRSRRRKHQETALVIEMIDIARVVIDAFQERITRQMIEKQSEFFKEING